MTDDGQISIREIQHYLYCPHRWGLLSIDCAWAENWFVVRANLLHSRVHDPDRTYASRGRQVYTSVRVYNDEYGLFGVTDCIEARPSAKGALLGGEKSELTIVEYKPTKPEGREFNFDDAMQVFAQKLCVDSLFKTSCDAVIYYADTKSRVKLPFDSQRADYDSRLRQILTEMRDFRAKGVIPPVSKGQKCSGCSMKDLCMPKHSAGSVRREITAMLEGGDK